MRRSAQSGARVGGLCAQAHVEIDIGLQGCAKRRHRDGAIASEQRDRRVALPLRHQPGDGLVDLAVVLPCGIECIDPAPFLARWDQGLIGRSLSRVVLHLLL